MKKHKERKRERLLLVLIVKVAVAVTVIAVSTGSRSSNGSGRNNHISSEKISDEMSNLIFFICGPPGVSGQWLEAISCKQGISLKILGFILKIHASLLTTPLYISITPSSLPTKVKTTSYKYVPGIWTKFILGLPESPAPPAHFQTCWRAVNS